LKTWSRSSRQPIGAWLSLPRAWRLSVAWYHDRLDANFHERTPAEAAAIFAGLGLTDPFWALDAATPMP